MEPPKETTYYRLFEAKNNHKDGDGSSIVIRLSELLLRFGYFIIVKRFPKFNY